MHHTAHLLPAEVLTPLLQDPIPVTEQPLPDLVLQFPDLVLLTVHLPAAAFTVQLLPAQPTLPVPVQGELTAAAEVTVILHQEAAAIQAEAADIQEVTAAEATHPLQAAEAAEEVTPAAAAAEEAATHQAAEAAHAAAVLLQEDNHRK